MNPYVFMVLVLEWTPRVRRNADWMVGPHNCVNNHKRIRSEQNHRSRNRWSRDNVTMTVNMSCIYILLDRFRNH